MKRLLYSHLQKEILSYFSDIHVKKKKHVCFVTLKTAVKGHYDTDKQVEKDKLHQMQSVLFILMF